MFFSFKEERNLTYFSVSHPHTFAGNPEVLEKRKKL